LLKTSNIDISVQNFQIDNSIQGYFPLVIYPDNQIVPNTSQEILNMIELEEGGIKPFFKIFVSRSVIQNYATESTSKKLSKFEVDCQEFSIFLDHPVFSIFLTFIDKLYQEKIEIEKQKIEEVKVKVNPSDYCETLKTSMPDPLYFKDSLETSGIVFIEHFVINDLKINLTLRVDMSTIEVTFIPDFLAKILKSANSISRISHSPIYLDGFIKDFYYSDNKTLIGDIKQHYISKLMFQIFKILGSSELLGDPMGLCRKVGVGISDLIMQPIKGAKKGNLGLGVAKAEASFLENVMGAGFNSISKITGTMLGLKR